MGETIEQIKKQLNEFWQGLDKKKKIKLGVSAILLLSSITAIIYFTTRTEYDVLYSNLSLKDAGVITEKLDEMGIQWKNKDNDPATIMVPKDLKNKVKIQLATEGLPKEGYSFIDAFNDTSWTMTDFEKKERLKYALQSELASTISEIDGVESSNVYLDIPDETSFVLNEGAREPKASVFLKLSYSTPLSSDKIFAIRNLVAGAIKGMKPENVTITDDAGRLLSDDDNNNNLESFDIVNQLNMQQTVQAKINDSIRKFLENVYGQGNVDVRANVKMNFDSEITNIVEFSPPIEGNEEGLIRSMEELEEHSESGIDGGVPGVESNAEDTPPDYVQIDESTSRYDKASRIINYELNEINKQIKKSPGEIEGITVAILVNKEQMTDEEKKEIRNLIYAATGLDTKQVEVNAQLFGNKEEGTNLELEVADFNLFNWAKENPLYIALILLSALAGTAGFIVYRRNKKKTYDINEVLREVAVESKSLEDIDLDKGQSEVMGQITKFVEKKPDQVAQLLRTWLNEE